MGLLFALLNHLNFDEMCIVTNLKYIITVCYDVIIFYNFLPKHSFFFPLVYIQLSLGNRIPTFLGKSCQLCLPPVHSVVALLYLSVFPFGVGGLMWI